MKKTLSAALLVFATSLAQSQQASTAWHKGRFLVEPRGVVERSDIVLQRPNGKPAEAMPLGNGRLGLAVWAQEGYTAQLNRADTFPARLSPGQVVIPGLKRLADAADYSARLNLYDGQLEERGGGLTATSYVAESLDALVVEITGADPKEKQTAELRLWEPRAPQVFVKEKLGGLAETWKDDKQVGASHETFGSPAAITADGADVRAEQVSPVVVRITFRPHADGSFRILVASPSWRGGDAPATATKLLDEAQKLPDSEHRVWWNQFWSRVGLMKLVSADHAAEYLENLRTIDLFTAAASGRDRFPGGQAGVADLFSPFEDHRQWDPADFWHFNLRMQVSANLSAGAFELNAPYFHLYRENLPRILEWTKQHMGGRAGVCVPETMRFNGQGYENEAGSPPAKDCAEDSEPFYNARTITTGAEVSLWIWQRYLYTDDLAFLKENYPVMRESARFLLAYATHDKEGGLHTFPSNAHESQWDVHDPITDNAAMRSLFPVVMDAARVLKTDDELATRLQKELAVIPQWSVVKLASPKALVPFDANDTDTILAFSYDPGAFLYNNENVSLEPVWPYSLIGDDGPLHALGVRTFLNRPNKYQNDWSFDPEQAARLGLAEELKTSLITLTRKHQAFPSGFAKFIGSDFYIEQIGVVADSLQSALVQDYDGLIRIAPAWPKDWDADATVYLHHRGRIHLQIHGGELQTVGIEAGDGAAMRIRNPWPGERAAVTDARTGKSVLAATSASVLELHAAAGGAYTLSRAGQAGVARAVEAVSSAPANAPRVTGENTIGLPK